MPTTSNTPDTKSSLDYQSRPSDAFKSSNYNVESLHFPKDLMGGNSKYGDNYIVFYVNVQKDSNITLDNNPNEYVSDGIAASSMGKRPDIKNNNNTVGGTVAGAAAGAAVVAGAGTLVGGGTVARASGNAVKGAATGAAVSGLIMSQSGSANRSTRRLKAAIALHNPNNVTIRYSSDWGSLDTAEMAMMQGDFGGSDSGGKTIASLVGGGIIGATTNLALTKAPGANLLSAKSGIAANAKKEMLFRGIDFRSFTFDYKFSPRSSEELALAQNIIKMFKFHMHPEFVPGRGNYLYLYPSEFDIMYYNNGNENRNMPRYTSCVLVDMTVNYTPNGNFNSFEGGAPTQIDISLNFKELATLTKSEIADGY